MCALNKNITITFKVVVTIDKFSDFDSVNNYYLNTILIKISLKIRQQSINTLAMR